MHNRADEPRVVHDMKNQLGIVLGYCDLLLESTSETDSRRRDYQEMRKAALNVLALLPDVVSLFRGDGKS